MRPDLQVQENESVALARQVLASLRPDVAAALRDLASGPERQNLRPHRATGRPPGIQLTGAGRQLNDRAWLEAEYATKSAQAIAASLGVNVKTVLDRMRRHGIDTRGPAESSKLRNAQSREQRRDAFVTALRAWSEEHEGRSPTQSEWACSRPTGAGTDGTARDLFGGWNKALAAAGLAPRKSGTNQTVNERRERYRRDLVQGLRQWAEEHDGDAPTQSEWAMTRPTWAPSDHTARNLYGTWNGALVAAGLKPRKPGEVKNRYHATAAGEKPAANRQMVTGKGLNDRLPGTVKHFGDGMRDAA